MSGSSSLLELPPELLIYALSFVRFRDLFACQATSRFLRRTVTESLLLQYNLETQVACVENNLNPHVTLSIPERLGLLRQRESAWTNFRPDFTTTIPIPYISGSVYELSAGLFVLGKDGRQTLGFLTLPSTIDPEPRWRYLDIDRQIVDFALAIYEHNLLVIVSSPKNEPQVTSVQKNLKIHFMVASTGAPHPRAQFPVLDIPFSTDKNPSLALEVVGDHLALITMYDRAQIHGETPDHFYIYEWISGALKLEITAPNHSYGGLIFLSMDVLLLSNATTLSFEFWRIPSSTEIPRRHPMVVLDLPRLRSGIRVIHISSRGEPNPGRTGSPIDRHPFHASDHDSILIFNMWLHLANEINKSFQFFAHRGALLDIFESSILHGVPPDAAPAPVPWNDWGPPVTRWFDIDISKEWITTTSGYRCVLCLSHAPWDPEPLIVLDFNPHHVRRFKASEHEDDPNLSCMDSLSLTDSSMAVFVRPVVSRLPYIASQSVEKYDYSGVMIDEERLLGIRRDDLTYKTIAIDVLHFG